MHHDSNLEQDRRTAQPSTQQQDTDTHRHTSERETTHIERHHRSDNSAAHHSRTMCDGTETFLTWTEHVQHDRTRHRIPHDLPHVTCGYVRCMNPISSAPAPAGAPACALSPSVPAVSHTCTLTVLPFISIVFNRKSILIHAWQHRITYHITHHTQNTRHHTRQEISSMEAWHGEHTHDDRSEQMMTDRSR